MWIVISSASSSTFGAGIKPSVSLFRQTRDTKCSSSVRSLIRVKGMSNIYGCDVCAVESCCSYMTSPGSREALTLGRFRPTLSPHHEPILEINLSDGFSNLLYSAFFFPILTPMSEFFVLQSNKYYCLIFYWTLVMVFQEDNFHANPSSIAYHVTRTKHNPLFKNYFEQWFACKKKPPKCPKYPY